MMKKIFIIISIAVVSIVKAQVGINTTTPNLSSMLDIVSSDKGVLFPQYELVSLTNNTSPVNNPVNVQLFIIREQEYLIILALFLLDRQCLGKDAYE
jgi:hypothetical protein